MPPIKANKEMDLVGTLHNLTDAFVVRAQAGDPDVTAAAWVLKALLDALQSPDPDSEALAQLESVAQRQFKARPPEDGQPPFPLTKQDWTEKLAKGLESLRTKQASSTQIASYAMAISVESQPSLPALKNYHDALNGEKANSQKAYNSLLERVVAAVDAIDQIAPNRAPSEWSERATRAILKTLGDPQYANALKHRDKASS